MWMYEKQRFWTYPNPPTVLRECVEDAFSHSWTIWLNFVHEWKTKVLSVIWCWKKNIGTSWFSGIWISRNLNIRSFYSLVLHTGMLSSKGPCSPGPPTFLARLKGNGLNKGRPPLFSKQDYIHGMYNMYLLKGASIKDIRFFG